MLTPRLSHKSSVCNRRIIAFQWKSIAFQTHRQSPHRQSHPISNGSRSGAPAITERSINRRHVYTKQGRQSHRHVFVIGRLGLDLGSSGGGFLRSAWNRKHAASCQRSPGHSEIEFGGGWFRAKAEESGGKRRENRGKLLTLDFLGERLDVSARSAARSSSHPSTEQSHIHIHI